MAKIAKAAYGRTRERANPISRSRQSVQYTLTKSTGNRVKTYDQTATLEWPNKGYMTDVVTPGFEQIKASGGYVMTAMSSSSTLYQEQSTGCSFRYEDTASVIDWTESSSVIATYFGNPINKPITTNIQNLISLTQTKCLAQVRDSNLMGMVSLAEAGKTVRMLANPLGTLNSLLQHISNERKAGRNLKVDWINGELRRVNGRVFRVRTTKYKGPGRVVTPSKKSLVIPIGEAISGTVLANNLGLRPLLMDIDSIMHQIPKSHQLTCQTYRAKSDDKQVSTSTEVKKASVLNATFARTDTNNVTVRCTVVAEDRFDVLSDFGLSLSDVPEAAWELIPYSFLLDYVVNIGDCLAALKAISQRKLYAWTTTVLIDALTERTLTSWTIDPPWNVVAAATGSDSNQLLSKYRNCDSFTPSLAYRPINQVLTPSHIQNALSLTVQLLTGLNQSKRTPFY